ncbi:Asp-tRNA(Asn)/Glu-tRNA(Gln) amidotransferase subunit GatB [Candidatus Kaiserbacteria bacterium CG10_big_fil_rev_8_21_14_0_10_49_17]|uniref:Aspartyl/glutamyl-tRNA(Asn/Gln) amidotransferase subunit B n=1 Tax=Candidatus Kaiserbacteria bacterium CG10_big_fil_rev_8_21_14_0_10_49_17 TaxID=1974609 RepID=A0A2M6WEU1_9BACT|nr:MAG: Asp-tRNA(Asn)/Glu-tRNA(Gln) amidotransferase subunit GatB [Candidatus Kaiserbacteria bacterium CG10_big_fil_rev_8_21_14_0_10_49_17]
MQYTPTIGLEIHAELKTRTKMFCDSRNDPDEREPNVHICPVCLAHPGTLPVINKEAVHHVLRVGAAVRGVIADYTEFDRKNYFYPDIPKGYQISQYTYPLVSNGELAGVALTRIHLEEDTARSSHLPTHAGDRKSGTTRIDYNRAGIPLMELVTEPVVTSAEQAGRFARELQLLLRTLGASDANMEKGEMRVEANISISKDKTFGTKVEVKNINSFRAVERAIQYEVARQIEVLESGGEIVQETRGWDEAKQRTFSQRIKEGSADYRYFPDPDLPKLMLSDIPEFREDALIASLPELPWEKRERYQSIYGLDSESAEMLVRDRRYSEVFEESVRELGDKNEIAQIVANYLTSDVAGLENAGKGELENSTSSFSELMKMVIEGEISSRGAKDILAKLLIGGGSARAIAEAEGLFQESDEGALSAIIDEVITENQAVVDEYTGGKESALQFLIGQGMKKSKGSANPALLQKLFKEKLQ